MRIREFCIDRFGLLHNQRVSALSPGLTVILGDNEAGKSTCLNFFRAMLFGYARNRRSIDYLTDTKAVSGGGLVLDSESFGLVRLARKPGPHGGVLSLTDADGAPRPEADLAVLLRGCTPDLFDKVFAFSLGELMHVSSLADDTIRHALHGAAFGTGLRSPAQVLKTLDEEMKRLFAPRASSSKIHKLLQELDTVTATIRERGNEVDRYAVLGADLAAAAAELASSRSARLALDEERAVLERTMSLRHRWEALCDAGNVLAALPEQPGTFAPDGRERLDRLLDRRDERRHALSAARRALERAREELAAQAVDPALAAAAAPLLALLERKERLRDAVGRAGILAAERTALATEVAAVCADLGPGWDAARLAVCDLSLAAHEACRATGRNVTEAEQEALRATGEAERMAGEERAAATALDEARAALRDAGAEAGDAPGSDAAPGDEAALDTLAQALVRAGDASAATGELARAVSIAEQALDQAIAALHSTWTRQNLEAVTVPPAMREACLHRARSVIAAGSALADRERDARAAALLHADAGERAAVLESSVAAQVRGLCLGDDIDLAADPAGPFAALDQRRRALRRARAAWNALEGAEVAYRTANEQIGDIASLVGGSRKRPFPWSVLMLFAAATALVCGGGALYLGLADGGETLARAGTASLAVGGALLAVWLVLALRGGDAAAEATQRNWEAIEKRLIRQRLAAQNARDEAEALLDALVREHADLFPDGIAGQDALADAEQELARRRERLALLERDLRDRDRERAALAAACARRDEAKAARLAAQNMLDEAHTAWRTALEAANLPPETPAEEGTSLFERLDAALARLAVCRNRLAEQQAARDQITTCLRAAQAIPDLADALASLPEPDSHFAPDHGAWLALAHDHLTRCRAAGRERLRLRELVAMRAARLEEVAAVRAGAEERRRRAQATLANAANAWQAWLEGAHLSPSLSPETARRALDAAAKSRAALDATRRIDSQQESIRRDVAAFVAELAPHAALLPGHPGAALPAGVAASAALPDAAIMAGLLSLLDDLAALARAAGEKAAVCRDRERELPALADAVALAEEQAAAAEAELASLLHLGQSDSPEGFRAAHAVWERREAALTAEGTIRAALTREAMDAELHIEALAAAFSAADRSEMEATLEERKRLVGEALHREHELAARTGALEAGMAGLMDEKGLTALLARRESLTGELEALAREWSRLAVARELLLTAKGRFESERRTGVVRTAGEVFRTITGGAYSGITVSLDDESVGAVTADGRVLQPEGELSRGTREQLYLALRLAYVLDHGAQAEKLPVIMDDILVNFDAVRARNTAAALAPFADAHQTLFFTCHVATAAMLAETVPGSVTYSLQKGSFRLL